MPRALVTGGAGFIGSHVTDSLIDDLGFEVVVLDDLSGGVRENVHPRATFVQGSIVDAALVNRLFADEQFDYVYHLAAYAAEGLSHFIKRFNYTNNVIGSVNLINASVNHNVKGFVFTSSIAVYGHNQVPMYEDLVPMPDDSYGIAKLTTEMELRVSRKMFGLDYIIFRPHNVYGERQNIGDKYRNVIGIFMNRLLRGEPLVIFGDGEQRRAFTYVKDIAPSIARSVCVEGAYGRTLNIGADQHYSVNELAELVCEVMGRRARIEHVPARNEVKIAYSDHSQFDALFPNIPHTPLRQGLEQMAAWVEAQGARTSKEFGEIEIERNLPGVWRQRD